MSVTRMTFPSRADSLPSTYGAAHSTQSVKSWKVPVVFTTCTRQPSFRSGPTSKSGCEPRI